MQDLASDLQYLIDHHEVLGLQTPLICILRPGEIAVVDGDRPVKLVVTGLNIVQGDGPAYIELELEEA